jgi:hypothetical protein
MFQIDKRRANRCSGNALQLLRLAVDVSSCSKILALIIHVRDLYSGMPGSNLGLETEYYKGFCSYSHLFEVNPRIVPRLGQDRITLPSEAIQSSHRWIKMYVNPRQLAEAKCISVHMR